MSWLPRIRLFGTAIGELDWEAEGWTVQLVVGRIVIEFAVAKIDREFPAETPDAR